MPNHDLKPITSSVSPSTSPFEHGECGGSNHAHWPGDPRPPSRSADPANQAPASADHAQPPSEPADPQIPENSADLTSQDQILAKLPVLDQTVHSDGSVSYHYQNDTGDIVMRDYKVFPGINVVFNDIHMKGCDTNVSASTVYENILEIDHCHEGRIECLQGEEFVYLAKGDLAVHQKSLTELDTMFPTGHYHGITISVDMTLVPESLTSILEGIDVRTKRLAQKFCPNGTNFIARANERLNHVFTELYDIPAEISDAYMKIKILEILLILDTFSTETAVQKRSFTASEVVTAKEACKLLLSNMDRHLTIEELAEGLHVSPTQLKKSFKGVYGESVFAFVRRQKMLSAATMLRTTNKTVLEIAGLHGYTNGGKFAAAFNEVIGMMPGEYRRQGD